MGYGITAKCRHCSHEEHYMLGIGMLYDSLESVLNSAVHQRYRKEIRAILLSHKPDQIEYSHKLYTCIKCETIHERFYVSMSTHGTLLHESNFRCGKCRGKLEQISADDVKNYRCGKCGKLEVECFKDGLCWD